MTFGLKVVPMNFDRRKVEIVLIGVAAVAFIACIASLMYLSGYIDGRLYASIYDSGHFKNNRVDDVSDSRAAPQTVEGEKVS